ncbi:MAG: hypothetical protein UY70_C0030G0015 [Candidatus Kaiserbacteria bacterium GW2011_GWB1_52_6]|uniref:General secretion pathway protein G n=2 Tax=Candidatus Kaiseribacteriota TaxID=1752734 RepID=A0A0G1X5N1_9BACT|nr:MAG: hypothetical protein UY67_C0025G0015 [Candidatus Kaiserbacteria bacterium GW2011_GWA2_52_12]KKW26291.1 MAG: hypothetical protein UY70_C0030G0015 [Candidatus Kaiserbacteria bacterium GW2011_GWB1_52_6]
MYSPFTRDRGLTRRATTEGFTLIELLVVIAIIGLLASIVLVSLNAARQKSRDARRISDLKQFQNALELYANDNNGTYPNQSTAGNVTGIQGSLVPNYISVLSADPSGGSVVYNYVSNAASNSTSYCIGALLEMTPPTPASTCASGINLVGIADYSGGANMNYAVGNS